MTVWGARTSDDVNARVSALQGQVRDLQEIETKLAARIAIQEGVQPDLSKISNKVSPSVFTIQAGDSLGSSWVASSGSSGSDLVTNYHVVQAVWEAGGRTVTVVNPSHSVQGTIASVSRFSDLALIHVSMKLPALKIITAKAQIGDPVAAFGSPLGLAGTVTSGIVSAYRAGVDERYPESEYLQFTAAINPGNSGGPVVDHQARVLGVTTFGLTSPNGGTAEGLSFAITSKDVCRAFSSLKC
jgi:putative serine protease PepD